MKKLGTELRMIVERAAPRLRAMSDEQASRARAAGKWSPKEIIGHLIDSAGNNHQRFVRTQLQGARPFDGYDQDEWVRLQRYTEADWSAVLSLWTSFNLHLAHMMDHVPGDELERPRPDLQFSRLSFRPAQEPVTLGWFMEDYIEHLKHHLRQIDTGVHSQ